MRSIRLILLPILAVACSPGSNVVIDGSASSSSLIAPDTDKLVLKMNALGTDDTLSGLAGAALGGAASIEVYKEQSLSTLVGSTTAVSADGSFDAFSIGDNQGTNDRVYVVTVGSDGTKSSAVSITNDITDDSGPNFGGLLGISAVSLNESALRWGLSADANYTSGDDVTIEICQSTTQGQCQTNFESTYTVSSGQRSHVVSDLTIGSTYYFLARAKDKAGNYDTNTEEKKFEWFPQISHMAFGTAGQCILTRAEGDVYCWGWNGNGTIGDGTTIDKSYPVKVPGITGALEVAMGGYMSCAIMSNNAVKCWGKNDKGQLGDGNLGTDSSSPVDVGVVTDARQIYSGDEHTCVILGNKTVYCWGEGAQGKLGNGTSNSDTPLLVGGGLNTAESIRLGIDHSCALLANGTVQCWGDNDRGQLGDGNSPTDSTNPVTVSGITTAVAIAAGEEHSCAALQNGTVQCWGYNEHSQLGDGTTTDSDTPITVPGITNAIDVVGGWDHSCALLADGGAKCWGWNNYGQIGTRTATNTKAGPTSVEGLTGVTGTAIFSSFRGRGNCVLTNDYRRVCWGTNNYGDLGNGRVSAINVPVSVVGLGSGNVSSIDISGNHGCALLKDGTAKCWGLNWYGGLGVGHMNPLAVPTQVVNVETLTALESTRYGTCFIESGGNVKCVGGNGLGQLGNGTSGNETSIATPAIVSGFEGATLLGAIGYTYFALVNGTEMGVGQNNAGQFGNGSSGANVLSATAASGLSGITQLAPGFYHKCVLLSDGSVKCMGDNGQGQLGNNDAPNDADTPQDINVIGANATSLGSGNWSSCVTHNNGGLYCWGDNSYGEIGATNLGSDVTEPTLITGVTGAQYAVGGNDHTCALLTDGKVQCWGRNYYGQLGDGTNNDSTTPQYVVGIENAKYLSSTDNFNCVITASDDVLCWGRNISDELGARIGGGMSLPVPMLATDSY